MAPSGKLRRSDNLPDERLVRAGHDKPAHVATAKPPTTSAVSLCLKQKFAAAWMNDSDA